jgi:hypothetical protein
MDFTVYSTIPEGWALRMLSAALFRRPAVLSWLPLAGWRKGVWMLGYNQISVQENQSHLRVPSFVLFFLRHLKKTA